jgi:hypothetical protein
MAYNRWSRFLYSSAITEKGEQMDCIVYLFYK